MSSAPVFFQSDKSGKEIFYPESHPQAFYHPSSNLPTDPNLKDSVVVSRVYSDPAEKEHDVSIGVVVNQLKDERFQDFCLDQCEEVWPSSEGFNVSAESETCEAVEVHSSSSNRMSRHPCGGGEGVISKYVQQFRTGPPRSKADREKSGSLVNSADFWWMQGKPAPAAASEPTNLRKSGGKLRLKSRSSKSASVDTTADDDIRPRESIDHSLNSSENVDLDEFNKKIENLLSESESLSSSLSSYRRPSHEHQAKASNTQARSHNPWLESQPASKHLTLPPSSGFGAENKENDILFQWRLRRKMEAAKNFVSAEKEDFTRQKPSRHLVFHDELKTEVAQKNPEYAKDVKSNCEGETSVSTDLAEFRRKLRESNESQKAQSEIVTRVSSTLSQNPLFKPSSQPVTKSTSHSLTQTSPEETAESSAVREPVKDPQPTVNTQIMSHHFAQTCPPMFFAQPPFPGPAPQYPGLMTSPAAFQWFNPYIQQYMAPPPISAQSQNPQMPLPPKCRKPDHVPKTRQSTNSNQVGCSIDSTLTNISQISSMDETLTSVTPQPPGETPRRIKAKPQKLSKDISAEKEVKKPAIEKSSMRPSNSERTRKSSGDDGNVSEKQQKPAIPTLPVISSVPKPAADWLMWSKADREVSQSTRKVDFVLHMRSSESAAVSKERYLFSADCLGPEVLLGSSLNSSVSSRKSSVHTELSTSSESTATGIELETAPDKCRFAVDSALAIPHQEQHMCELLPELSVEDAVTHSSHQGRVSETVAEVKSELVLTAPSQCVETGVQCEVFSCDSTCQTEDLLPFNESSNSAANHNESSHISANQSLPHDESVSLEGEDVNQLLSESLLDDEELVDDVGETLERLKQTRERLLAEQRKVDELIALLSSSIDFGN